LKGLKEENFRAEEIGKRISNSDYFRKNFESHANLIKFSWEIWRGEWKRKNFKGLKNIF
jgi:hypothetical protein